MDELDVRTRRDSVDGSLCVRLLDALLRTLWSNAVHTLCYAMSPIHEPPVLMVTLLLWRLVRSFKTMDE